MEKIIWYSFKMHVKLFVSCINKSYIQSLKTIPKLISICFWNIILKPINHSIYKKKLLIEIYIFKYKKLKKWIFFLKSKYPNPIQNNWTRTKNTRTRSEVQKYSNGFSIPIPKYPKIRNSWSKPERISERPSLRLITV